MVRSRRAADKVGVLGKEVGSMKLSEAPQSMSVVIGLSDRRGIDKGMVKDRVDEEVRTANREEGVVPVGEGTAECRLEAPIGFSKSTRCFLELIPKQQELH